MEEESINLLDLRGEICPMPVLRTKKRLENMEKSQILEVMVDYPVAKENILRMVQQMGEEVIEVKEEGHIFKIRIRKTK